MSSQVLSGIVYDENKQTIPGASVYLDGTSIGTITNDQGKYTLQIGNKINTLLIVSYVGYESVMIENPFDKLDRTIYLTPKANALHEVVVTSGLFTRKSMLRIFREQFLGITKAGKSCSISNEDDINFYYDKKTSQLSATSENPLLIKNDYLGYEIAFNLVHFSISFNIQSIKSADIASSFFAGTAFFKEMPDPISQLAARRKQVYSGSQMHFFRNLSRNVWGKKDFELFSGSYPVNPNDIFTVTPQNGMYDILIKDATNANNFSLSDGFYKRYSLLFNRDKQSGIIFKTASFSIDEYGNNNAIEQIIFSGEMGKYKVGNLLPLDFQP